MEKFIKNNQILSFIAFTYLFSWLLWSYLLVTQNITSATQWLIIIGGFGPAVGAIVTNYFTGGKEEIIKWFKKIINRNITIKSSIWISVFYPLIITFLVYIIIKTFNLNQFLTNIDTVWYLYPINLIFIMILGKKQEELGWRGFALPKLMNNFNPFTASIIVGCIWFVWHLPLVFIKGSAQSKLPILWYFINIIAISIILTYLLSMVKGLNIISAIIFHGGLNISQNYFDIKGTKAYFLFTILNILVVILLISKNKKFWYSKKQLSKN